MSRTDPTIGDPDHWLKKASPQEKLDHVKDVMKNRDPKFREIFDLTPVEGIKEETHVWRDLQLDSLPAGRVILMGDAAHVMAPFRGEGGYNTFQLPDHMSFEDAAALGLATAAAAYGLFNELQLAGSLNSLIVGAGAPRPGDFVLVAGGSTATGTRAIQLLKTAGFRPVATSSPSNFELVKRFGAEKVFDYHDPTCAEQIRTYTRNELDYALDGVAEAETTHLCYTAMGRAVEPFHDSIAQSRAHTIEPSWFNVMTIWGRKVELGGEYAREASAEDRAFGARSFAAVQTLLDRDLVTTHPVKVMPGAWEGVVQGVEKIRRQPPSGISWSIQLHKSPLQAAVFTCSRVTRKNLVEERGTLLGAAVMCALGCSPHNFYGEHASYHC